jgi:hypothetical protein
MGRLRLSRPDRSVVLSPVESEDTEGQQAKEGVPHNPPVPVKRAGWLTETDPSRLQLKCRLSGRLHGCQRSSADGSAFDSAHDVRIWRLLPHQIDRTKQEPCTVVSDHLRCLVSTKLSLPAPSPSGGTRGVLGWRKTGVDQQRVLDAHVGAPGLAFHHDLPGSCHA